MMSRFLSFLLCFSPIIALSQNVSNHIHLETGLLDTRIVRSFNGDVYFISGGPPGIAGLEVSYPDTASAVLFRMDFPSTVISSIPLSGDMTGQVQDYWVDSDSNIYILCGAPADSDGPYYVGELAFYEDTFVVKLNAQGEFLWSKDLTNLFPIRMTGDLESIVVCGNLEDSLSFAGQTLVAMATDHDIPRNACVLKMSHDGEEDWGAILNGEIRDFATDIGISPSGNVAMSGYSDSPVIDFAGEQYAQGGFLAVYAENGEELWMKNGFYEDDLYLGSTRFNSLAFDGSGNISVVANTWSDSIPTPLGELYYNCEVGASSHEAVLTWNQEGELLNVKNIGCRDFLSSEARLIWYDEKYYYAAHLDESTYLENDQNFPVLDDPQTVLMVWNNDLGLETAWASSNPDGENYVRISLSVTEDKLYMGSAFFGEFNFGNISLNDIDGFDYYILEIQLATTIEDVPKFPELKLFPNPSKDEINVVGNLGQNGVLEIYDMRGALVRNVKVSGSSLQTVSIVDLAKGAYIAKIRTESQTYVQQIVKI